MQFEVDTFSDHNYIFVYHYLVRAVILLLHVFPVYPKAGFIDEAYLAQTANVLAQSPLPPM